MSFDRKGKCPICHKEFRSEACPHTWDYVHRVVQAVKEKDFYRDVRRLKRKRR